MIKNIKNSIVIGITLAFVIGLLPAHSMQTNEQLVQRMNNLREKLKDQRITRECEKVEKDNAYVASIQQQTNQIIFKTFVLKEYCLTTDLPQKVAFLISTCLGSLAFNAIDLSCTTIGDTELFPFATLLANFTTFLNLCDNSRLTDSGVSRFINLQSLIVTNNSTITDVGIKGLTNLTTLFMAGDSPSITVNGISGLPKLRLVNLFGNRTITKSELSDLVNLNVIQ